MARFYTDENFSQRVVTALRVLGHDVLTALEAGQANQKIPDEDVVAFATKQVRAVLTNNRKHFAPLHLSTSGIHAGIVLCTYDADFQALANRIHQAVSSGPIAGQLIRVVRPSVQETTRNRSDATPANDTSDRE